MNEKPETIKNETEKPETIENETEKQKPSRVKRIKNAVTFTFDQVEIRDPLMKDFIKAETAAKENKGYKFSVCLLHFICKFEGKQVPIEELEKMDFSDFLELMTSIGLEESVNMPEVSSSSNEKEDSATPKSEK